MVTVTVMGMADGDRNVGGDREGDVEEGKWRGGAVFMVGAWSTIGLPALVRGGGGRYGQCHELDRCKCDSLGGGPANFMSLSASRGNHTQGQWVALSLGQTFN